MTLRAKMVVIVGVALAVYAVLNMAAQQLYFLPRFAEVENEAALQDVRRCILAVQREAEYLSQYCLDWAAWDDTYAFVRDRNPTYVEKNLSEDVFASRVVSLFYAIRYDGSVAWSRVWGLDDTTESPMYDLFPTDNWSLETPLLAKTIATGEAGGLINTPVGPMYIAVRPIVTSLIGSSPAGFLVMGRYLDAEFADRLRERTGVPFFVQPALTPDQFAEPFQSIGIVEGESVYAYPDASGQSLHVAATCCDLFDQATFVITADLPRTVFLQGQEAVRFTLLSLLLAGALLIVAVMGSVQAIVVRPLGALVNRLATVRTGGDLNARVSISRNDELGTLANEFNAMMTRLENDQMSRLASEEKLRVREAELSALFAAAPDAIVTFNPRGQILSVNAAGEKSFELSEAELLGHRITALIPDLPLPDDSSPAAAGTIPGNPTADGRELTGRRGGQRFPVHVRVSSVKTSDLFYVAIIRDITTLKQLHDAMARSRHLAQIGEMSASVAHEIRNPLAGISAALQVFRDGLATDDPRREILGEVFGQVRRLDNAVHNLLMFARPWTPECRPCDMTMLASEAIRDAANKPGFASIHLEIEDDSHGQAIVQADPHLLQQVFWNILENAAQAVEGEGRILCNILRENGSVVTRIRDTGKGLSPESLAHLFEPFYTTRMRGTGLGLAVCRRIIDAHGGTIALTNHPEGGAEVALTLPTG